jgi:hypothetical protein
VILLAILFMLVCILGWALEDPRSQSIPELRVAYSAIISAGVDGAEEGVGLSINGREDGATSSRNGLSRIRLLPY